MNHIGKLETELELGNRVASESDKVATDEEVTQNEDFRQAFNAEMTDLHEECSGIGEEQHTNLSALRSLHDSHEYPRESPQKDAKTDEPDCDVFEVEHAKASFTLSTTEKKKSIV